MAIQHKSFEILKKMVSTKRPVLIVGEAGSGKTYAAQMVAESMGLQFGFTGAVTQAHELKGFLSATNEVRSTQFRKIVEEGGIFCFDEMDGSSANVLLAFNAVLSSGIMDLPGSDKMVKVHKDTHFIACANTFGNGRNMKYVGRSKLDAASLDRFIMLEWGYDYDLERQMASDHLGGKTKDASGFDWVSDWIDQVQMIREIITEFGIQHIVSPRATLAGIDLIMAGVRDPKILRDAVIWKGLGVDEQQRIHKAIAERIRKKGEPKIDDGDFWAGDDATSGKDTDNA